MTVQGSPPKQDKAALLCALYNYLGGRIDSIGRRSSLLMAFIASFLGFSMSPLVRGSDIAQVEKLKFVFFHPSIIISIAAMIVLLWSELARVHRSDDLFTKIAFSDLAIGPLQDQFAQSSIDPLFGEMIVNTRIVGGFLKRKVKMYNTGSILFVVSVTLYALGLQRQRVSDADFVRAEPMCDIVALARIVHRKLFWLRWALIALYGGLLIFGVLATVRALS